MTDSYLSKKSYRCPEWPFVLYGEPNFQFIGPGFNYTFEAQQWHIPGYQATEIYNTYNNSQLTEKLQSICENIKRMDSNNDLIIDLTEKIRNQYFLTTEQKLIYGGISGGLIILIIIILITIYHICKPSLIDTLVATSVISNNSRKSFIADSSSAPGRTPSMSSINIHIGNTNAPENNGASSPMLDRSPSFRNDPADYWPRAPTPYPSLYWPKNHTPYSSSTLIDDPTTMPVPTLGGLYDVPANANAPFPPLHKETRHPLPPLPHYLRCPHWIRMINHPPLAIVYFPHQLMNRWEHWTTDHHMYRSILILRI